MTKQSGARHQRGRTLRKQLRWLVRLRWIAGGAIAAGTLLESQWWQWYGLPLGLLSVGLVVLAYNGAFWLLLRRDDLNGSRTRALALCQIVLDLLCLSVLVAYTGGLSSPLLGFYVLHMVFASLLLPPATAYGGAGLAIIMLLAVLLPTGQIQADRLAALRVLGWATVLVATVFLANRVTVDLRRHRRRLILRNRRIRQLVERLKRQQLAMIQHEKAVTMGQMAAGLAHEIANPLASLDSVLQLMQRGNRPLTPEKLAVLREQVDRIRKTLRQVADFAHPTAYGWETVDLNDLVDLGLQIIRFDRRLNRIKLEVEPAPAPCRVRAQPHAIQQALTNLLINALDALAEVPQPRLVVRAHQSADETVIEVIDNGSGIHAEHRADIFEPFFTTKPVGKGTGLGLAISQTLVRQQDGRIEYAPTPGGGATFRVILPGSAMTPTAGQEVAAEALLSEGTEAGTDSQR